MKEQEVVLRDFTTVEQSKILSEFLPTKTANMVYCYTKEGDKLISPIPIHLTSTPTNTFKYLYCWSLAALLEGVLPNKIVVDNIGYEKSCNFSFGNNSWYLSYYDEYATFCTLVTTVKESLLDACYEMILKLHKQKLL